MVKDDYSRFWSKVCLNFNVEPFCHRWLAAKDQNGYGRFLYQGKNQRAHRVAWILTFGPIQDNEVVMHDCDNPSCVNPDHLRLGSQLENIQDRVQKGRCAHNTGSSNSQAKLTQHQVDNIRSEYNKTKCTKRSLAKKYKVSDSTVSRILNNQTWS